MWPEALASRQRLEEFFAGQDLPYWPSRANFVLARFGHLRVPFVEAMRQRGILVRDRNSDYGCEGCVRITAGTSQLKPIAPARAMKEVLRILRVGESR